MPTPRSWPSGPLPTSASAPEKATYGYEKTTIIDVWNELERRHSGGRVRRRFFNAIYLTNPRIFSLVKRLK
ncbi:MAG: hypothetical protein PVG27_07075 [Chloroflexota bacterium]